jgi:hypothetical protein
MSAFISSATTPGGGIFSPSNYIQGGVPRIIKINSPYHQSIEYTFVSKVNLVLEGPFIVVRDPVVVTIEHVIDFCILIVSRFGLAVFDEVYGFCIWLVCGGDKCERRNNTSIGQKSCWVCALPFVSRVTETTSWFPTRRAFQFERSSIQTDTEDNILRQIDIIRSSVQALIQHNDA